MKEIEEMTSTWVSLSQECAEEYSAASKTLKASPHFRNWLVKPQNFESFSCERHSNREQGVATDSWSLFTVSDHDNVVLLYFLFDPFCIPLFCVNLLKWLYSLTAFTRGMLHICVSVFLSLTLQAVCLYMTRLLQINFPFSDNIHTCMHVNLCMFKLIPYYSSFL